MNRQKANFKIIKRLKNYFKTNPEIRFFQGLWNLGIIEWDNSKYVRDLTGENGPIKDKHHEESEKTLDNLK